LERTGARPPGADFGHGTLTRTVSRPAAAMPPAGPAHPASAGGGRPMATREEILAEVFELALQNDINYFG